LQGEWLEARLALNAAPVALDDVYNTPEDVPLVVWRPSVQAEPLGGWVEQIAESQPLNWWRFEELQGPTAIDQGSEGADGTYVGGVSRGEIGLTGRAVRMDGTGAVLVKQGNLPTPWTVEGIFSVQVPSGAASQGLLGALAGLTTDATAIKAEQYANTGVLGYTLFTVADVRFEAPTPSELTHVVMVGTQSGVELYVDGQKVGHQDLAIGLSRYVIGGGASDAGGYLNDPFHGVVDELVIYNRALAEDEIVRHFDSVAVVSPDPSSGIESVGVLGNDTDADGDVLSARLEAPPAHGTIRLQDNGTFRYVPDADFSGVDYFGYSASDGSNSTLAMVAIHVSAVDDPPTAADDGLYEVDLGGTLEVPTASGVLLNDTDPDSHGLWAALVNPPARGTVVLRDDGSFTYVPGDGMSGIDHFTYRASDGSGQSEPATVLIRVTRTTGDQIGPVPVAADDRYSVAEDETLVVDTSPMRSILTISQPAADLVHDRRADLVYATIPAGAGTLANTLTPIDPYTGQLGPPVAIGDRPSRMVISDGGEIIHAVVEDGHAVQMYDLRSRRLGPKYWMSEGDRTGVSVNSIQPFPGRPEAVVLTRRLVHTSPHSAGSGIYVNGVLLPDHLGSGGPDLLAVNETGDRIYGYQNSLTSFDFWVLEADDRGMRTRSYHPWASVLSGFGVDRMVVGGDHLFVTGGAIIDLSSLKQVGSFLGGENFVVVPSENTLYSLSSGDNRHRLYAYDLSTLRRKASVDVPGVSGSTGSLVRFGDDGLAYRTSDNRIVLVRSDALFGITRRGVLRNNGGPADATLQAVLVDDADHGVLRLNPDGTFQYEPHENFVGTDTFQYTVSDGQITSNVSTVTITVTPVNDPPVAQDDHYVWPAKDPLVIPASSGVLANDRDPVEGDALIARVEQRPAHGRLTLSRDGSFRYTPGESFDVTDQFTYRASDGSSSSRPATVTITRDVPKIEVGEHLLRANTPGQTIELFVTGGQPLAGVDLYVQVGDGGPELAQVGLPAGTYGPAITSVDLKTNTIFADVAEVARDLGSLPQVTTRSISVTGGEDVRGLGRLATVVVDTTGIFAGSWDLRLSAVLSQHLSGPFDTRLIGLSAQIANGTIRIEPAAVVGRYVFYNNSSWDGNDDRPTAGDDLAIATDKSALLPGQTATFANYTSYSKGINGVMVDISGEADPSQWTRDDFEFRVGRDSMPSAWALAPTPAMSVRPGAGAQGSDRITFTWPDGVIRQQWLEVRVKAGPRTLLARDDVFYFGNAIGETGDEPGRTLVAGADVVATWNVVQGPPNPASITDVHDFNRDRLVSVVDMILARDHQVGPLTALPLITPATSLQEITYVRPGADGGVPLPGTGENPADDPGGPGFRPRAGDANRDGLFDRWDLVLVLQGARYLSDASAAWEEGDWTGDGRFDSTDIVAALQTGDYRCGS
jgi:VCBS repeat-containing protein